MKQLLLIFLLFVGFGARAQFDVELQYDVVMAPPEADEGKTEIYLTNNFTGARTVYWKVEKSPTFPSDWVVRICDLNLCYNDDVLQCSPNMPSSFASGQQGTFTFYVDPNGYEGVDNVVMYLYDNNSFTNLITSFTIPINISMTSSVASPEIARNQSLYPNPVDSYFKISNDQSVSKIGIYDVLGKEVTTLYHRMGQSHDISEFQNGMYIVRLFDRDGDILKVMRLSKRGGV